MLLLHVLQFKKKILASRHWAQTSKDPANQQSLGHREGAEFPRGGLGSVCLRAAPSCEVEAHLSGAVSATYRPRRRATVLELRRRKGVGGREPRPSQPPQYKE